MSKVQPNLCYSGVAGLLLSLHCLSVPFQSTNTHHGDASYCKSGHGQLTAFALQVPGNVQLLIIFVGLWVLAILIISKALRLD